MNFIIIGGNATGMSAATRLRKNMPDASIIVLEKSNIVSFGACGLPYFLGEEFTDSNDMIARPLEAFQQSNIDVRLYNEAVKIDAHNKTVTVLNNQTQEEYSLSYDKALISSGAHPIMPPMEGIELDGVHPLTTIKDGQILKEKIQSVKDVVIIGAGFIGLEVAEAMLHHGKNVTVIERNERVSSRVFEPEMTEHLEEVLTKHGVTLRLGEGVQKIIGTTKVEGVQTDKGTYKADLVIMAVGFAPATKWCQDSGLEMLPNGALIIDELCQTNLPDIYAGGDCAVVKNAASNQNAYIPLATTANKLGRLLGDTLAGKPMPFQGTLGSSALRFMNFEIARTGITEKEAQMLNIPYSSNTISDFNHTSYVPGKSKLYIKLIYHKETKVLLGAQMCGEKDAVLRVDALAVAIFKKMTVQELGMMDFIYAPPFARTWDIMNIAGNTSR